VWKLREESPPWHICRAVAFADKDLVAFGHQYRPHKVVVGYIGLHYLLQSGGFLSESGAGEQEQNGCTSSDHGFTPFQNRDVWTSDTGTQFAFRTLKTARSGTRKECPNLSIQSTVFRGSEWVRDP
jgi:hypothetical protein